MSELKYIPLTRLKPPEHDIRSTTDPEKLQELAESIKTHGILQPILVRKVDGEYEIIAGYRRAQAAKIAGLESVPCRVLKPSDDVVDLLKLHENIHREDMSPLDEARLIDYLKKKFGWSHRQVAKAIGKSEAHVTYRLQILYGPEDVKEAVEKGEISPSVGRELALIKDDTKRRIYLDAAKKGGATHQQAQQWRQMAELEAKEASNPPPAYEAPSPSPRPSIVMHPCPGCRNLYDINEFKILRLCPSCYEKLMEAFESSEEEEE